jgi:pyruvate/2-oxoglutarate dehydrogenase complex dihydrolipoamide acyltransferase (E2) component
MCTAELVVACHVHCFVRKCRALHVEDLYASLIGGAQFVAQWLTARNRRPRQLAELKAEAARQQQAAAEVAQQAEADRHAAAEGARRAAADREVQEGAVRVAQAREQQALVDRDMVQDQLQSALDASTHVSGCPLEHSVPHCIHAPVASYTRCQGPRPCKNIACSMH